jgi:hypothetical protein
MGTPTPGTVTVTRGMTVGHVGPGFVGLSYEKAHLTDAYMSGSNAALIGMCKLLGPSVLRIGGNAVDATNWVPTAQPVAPGTVGTDIGTVDVDNLAAFLSACGWKVIYGINLKSNTPSVAADEATYVAGKLGANLYAFTIGNEVDLFGQPYSTVLANWNSDQQAIKTAVANVQYAGPDTGGTGSGSYNGWTVPFAGDEAGTIFLLTQHYYRGNGMSASSTMSQLLAPDPGLSSMLQAVSNAASSNNLQGSFRISEVNSFYNHGAPGVSDALGAALWSIDFMFATALQGGTGTNFHGGGPGQDPKHVGVPFYYSPIEEANSQVVGAKPIFYGLLLFSLAGTGDMFQTTAMAGSLNFSAYSIAQTDGSINVVLSNKDATTPIQASVDTGGAVASAEAIYLQGPSLTATSGVTLAGAGVSPTGAWKSSAPYSVPVSGNAITVLVPPASAALVHVQ